MAAFSERNYPIDYEQKRAKVNGYARRIHPHAGERMVVDGMLSQRDTDVEDAALGLIEDRDSAGPTAEGIGQPTASLERELVKNE